MAQQEQAPQRTQAEIEADAARRSRGLPRPTDDDGDEPVSGRDAGAQLARARAELRQLRTAHAALEADFNDYRTAANGGEKRLKEEFATQVGQREARHADDLALVSAGVHDELGRDTIRRAREGAPKDARGESASKWWAAQVEAHKTAVDKGEQPLELPRALAAYLPQVDPPGRPGQKEAPRQAPARPWAGSQSDRGVATRQAANPLDKALEHGASKDATFGSFVAELTKARQQAS